MGLSLKQSLQMNDNFIYRIINCISLYFRCKCSTAKYVINLCYTEGTRWKELRNGKDMASVKFSPDSVTFQN